MKTNMMDIWKHRVKVNPRNIDFDALTCWLDTEVGQFGVNWAYSYGIDNTIFYFQDDKHAVICSLRCS